MSAKHTPGPWCVKGTVVVAPWGSASGVLQIAQMGIQWDAVDGDATAANAALIAAAPDLLAAAEKRAEADHDDLCGSGGDSCQCGKADLVAAIAKARGGA